MTVKFRSNLLCLSICLILTLISAAIDTASLIRKDNLLYLTNKVSLSDPGDVRILSFHHNSEITDVIIENVSLATYECDKAPFEEIDGFKFQTCLTVDFTDQDIRETMINFLLAGKFPSNVELDDSIIVKIQDYIITSNTLSSAGVISLEMSSVESVLKFSTDYQLTGKVSIDEKGNQVFNDITYTPSTFIPVQFTFTLHNMNLYHELNIQQSSKYKLDLTNSYLTVASNYTSAWDSYITLTDCSGTVTDLKGNVVRTEACSPSDAISYSDFINRVDIHSLTHSTLTRQCQCLLYIVANHDQSSEQVSNQVSVTLFSESNDDLILNGDSFTVPSFNTPSVNEQNLYLVPSEPTFIKQQTHRAHNIRAYLPFHGRYYMNVKPSANFTYGLNIINIDYDQTFCEVQFANINGAYNTIIIFKNRNSRKLNTDVNYCDMQIIVPLGPYRSSGGSISIPSPVMGGFVSNVVEVNSYTALIETHGIVGSTMTDSSTRLRVALTDTVLTPETFVTLSLSDVILNVDIGTDSKKDKEILKTDQIYVSCEHPRKVCVNDCDHEVRLSPRKQNVYTATTSRSPDSAIIYLKIALTDQDSFVASYFDQPLFCDIVLPFTFKPQTILLYSFDINSISYTKSYDLAQNLFNFNLLSSTNSESDYNSKVTHLTMGTKYQCNDTNKCDKGKFDFSLIIPNNFKAQSLINCTQTFTDNTPVEILSIPSRKIGASHFAVDITQFSLSQSMHEHSVLINCYFVNSDKYVTKENSPISLLFSDSLPLLDSTVKIDTNFNQLPQSIVNGLTNNIFDMYVEPSKEVTVKAVVAKLEWTDIQSKINMKVGHATDVVYKAAKSIHKNFKRKDLFKLDLTVNGANHVTVDNQNNTSPFYHDVDDVADFSALSHFQITSQQHNQYSVSFGFNSGFDFNLKDLQLAIENELSQNGDLQDMSTSTILDDIISQCLSAGYGCGALCAPCTGSDACKSDSDCITGVCSFNQCQAYDTEIFTGDNSAVNYFNLPLLSLLIMFYVSCVMVI